jgi:surface polysaccharide O-acyltransferase-like enzyme
VNVSKNILWVDGIRVVAIFTVVLLHSAYPLLERFNSLPISFWWIGNIYYSISTIGVPMFFMLTGYLLLGKTEPLFIFFKKRVQKVIFPLLIWSFFYIIWKVIYEESTTITFQTFYSLLFTPVYHHFWFLYAIIGLYLFIPILRIMIQHSPPSIQYYFVALWLLAVSVIPFFEEAIHMKSWLDMRMISGYVGYLVVGYLLGNRGITRKQVVWAGIVGIISIMITTSGSFYCIIRSHGNFYRFFYGYLTPNVVSLSICAFLILKYLIEKERIATSNTIKTVIRHVSSASFGIYMIHVMFLALLGDGVFGFSINAFYGHPLYSVFLTAFITFMMSFFFVSFLKRIPVIKYCVF